MPERRPYSRGEYNRALIVNALLDPFNVVLLAVILIVGILLHVVVPVLPVAGVVYLAAAARTYFDDDAANKVLERERSKQGKDVERERRRELPQNLAPPIARLVEAARLREARIRDAIERAELPYDEVAAEVDGFLVATEGTARRAQLLYEALEDTPPERVAARLEQVRARSRARRARGGPLDAAGDPPAHGAPARPLLRRARAHHRRARHGPLAARLDVGLDRDRPAGPPGR